MKLKIIALFIVGCFLITAIFADMSAMEMKLEAPDDKPDSTIDNESIRGTATHYLCAIVFGCWLEGTLSKDSTTDIFHRNVKLSGAKLTDYNGIIIRGRIPGCPEDGCYIDLTIGTFIGIFAFDGEVSCFQGLGFNVEVTVK